MGWDVVQIGLKHDLPVHDIHEVGMELAKRLKSNIRFVAIKEFKYDGKRNRLSDCYNMECIEIEQITSEEYSEVIKIEVPNFQAKQIRSKLSDEKVKSLKFNSIDTKEWFEYQLENQFALYKFQFREHNIDIFEENVYLDIHVLERYGIWQKAFHHYQGEWRNWLLDYRKKHLEIAKLFGCKNIIICCDQGPTMEIYDRMDMKSDDLLEYSKSRQYNNDQSYYGIMDDWEKYEKQIDFRDYLDGKINLTDEDYVSVVYDKVD